jgi:hypothetical protein
MNRELTEYGAEREEFLPMRRAENSTGIALPGMLGTDATRQLTRMFRDPRVLEKDERLGLIAELRQAVELSPEVAEVKVLLGMALSVDLQAQEAMEILRTATEQKPDSFIARLKYGELLMRLRICAQAQEETHKAALLAANVAQSELARRQAATVRVMLREGVERGGYGGLLGRVFGSRRKNTAEKSVTVLAAAE